MSRSLAALLILAASAAPLQAGPRAVRLSWSQPDTATTMTVTWQSDSTGDPSVVRYGTDGDLDQEATGTVFQGNEGLGAIHVVELTELTPDTSYTYQAGGPGAWSATYGFRTAPDQPCTPVHFVAFGDNRPDVDWLPQIHWNPILSEAAGALPLFLLHTGDIVKDGGDTGQWNTFFESSGDYLANTPFMASIGNHDDGPGDGDSANYNQLLAYPRNTVTQTEDFYFVTTPDLIVVSLSSQTFQGGSKPFQDQADWLDQVLTENPRPWKVVQLHHPPFTSHRNFDLYFWDFEFNHPPNEQDQNPALVPVFDKHHVDLVLSGHNHYYERFAPLKGGPDPAEGVLAQGFHDGTVYVITGGAGAFVYDEFDVFGVELDLISWICGDAAGSTKCSGKHHFVTVSIEGPALTYEAWATAEQTLDNDPSNAELLDSFMILKTGEITCPEGPVEPSPEPFAEPAPDVVEGPDAEPVGEVIAPDGAPDSPTLPDLAVDAPPREADVPGGGDDAGHTKDSGTAADTAPVPGGSGERSGGCAAAAPGATPWMLVLLGLLLVRRRRAPA